MSFNDSAVYVILMKRPFVSGEVLYTEIYINMRSIVKLKNSNLNLPNVVSE